MKKLMFLLPVAALAMAACSNEESSVQSSRTNAVVVNSVMQAATRGTVYTDANIFPSFNLIANGSFATAAINEAAVNKEYTMAVTKSGSSWTLGTPLYWGDATTAASFTAYAGGNASVTPSGGNIAFTVAENPADQTDFVVAYNRGCQTDFTAGVPLHFRHTLSQILVKASYNTDNTYANSHPALTVKVKNVSIVNVNNASTLTLPTASTAKGETYEAVWAAPTGTKTYTSSDNVLTLGSSVVAIDNSDAVGPMLLMPQTQSALTDWTNKTGIYLKVSVDIDYQTAQGEEGYKVFDLYPAKAGAEAGDQTAGEGTYADMYCPININWQPGYKYTYQLNFSNVGCGKKADGTDIITGVLKPVTFFVTVEEEWLDGSSQTPAL